MTNSVTFDTSGWVDFGPHPEIELPDPVKFNRCVGWEDLSPFCQGFVEAAFADRSRLTRAEERKRPPCKLSDGQIWLLKCGRRGFSRTTLSVPYTGHGSTATNYMCAGLIRRGWLEENRNGIVRITEAGERALHTAMPLGFSDLHPATLARFMEDCEEAQTWRDDACDPAFLPGRAGGEEFWKGRQQGGNAEFPPLRLYFSPDGKVMAEEVSKESTK